jgi:hypothetical protein
MKTLDEMLSKVAWDQLEGAFGPATDVPEMVRQLGASGPEARVDAAEMLADNLNHQGSVYEPVAYLIEPLLFQLRSPVSWGSRKSLIFSTVLAAARVSSRPIKS